MEQHILKGFREISPLEIENAMKLIGKDWMLITAKDGQSGRVNAMTASWGCMGVLWNKNICVCFIRPQRYTYGLVEREERISLAFLSEEYRGALRLCGTKSGRDCDKLSEAGLTAETADGVPMIREASLLIRARKLYADDLKENAFIDPEMLKHYAARDYHRFYICEIAEVLVKDA